MPRSSPERDRTLLVVGGAGFLGVHVVQRGLEAGWSVVAVSRNDTFPFDAESGVRRLQADPSQPGRARAIVESVEPHAVVNCAALSRVADCERDPELARRSNVGLPSELALSCASLGVRCIHVSTDLVFGAERAPPGGFGEAAPVAPVSVYGRTKVEGESAVLAADDGAIVVRLPLLYGESFGRALGASDSVRAAVARGEHPVLFTDEWRTPLDVEDAASALVELAGSMHSGVLHVAGPERLNRHELGRIALADVQGAESAIRASLRADAGLADRPEDVSLDSLRAHALLQTRLRSPREALARRGSQ